MRSMANRVAHFAQSRPPLGATFGHFMRERRRGRLMCHAVGVTAIALAVLLGLTAFPVVLVFGPVYFPWSLLVLMAFGGAVGLAISRRGQRFLRALGLAVVMIAVVFGVRTLTSNVALDPSGLASNTAVVFPFLLSIGSLLVPVLVGISAGEALRARWGVGRATAVGVLGLFAIALFGAGLAFAFAPLEIANAPRCADSLECPRTRCAQMAERIRLFAVERVIAFDGDRITCTYTAWGGIYIGRADVGFPGGGSWTDGPWPKILRGR
jgi:hypothetical protein